MYNPSPPTHTHIYIPTHAYMFIEIVLFLYRVLKQALRSSGANATEKHIENVSLCGMFLMEAAHKVDSEFGVKRRSGKHTIRDSSGDIRRMTHHLLEKQVTSSQDGRTSPPCCDITEDGFAKMSHLG